jgi:uncharacterized protein (UPF0305 family)
LYTLSTFFALLYDDNFIQKLLRQIFVNFETFKKKLMKSLKFMRAASHCDDDASEEEIVIDDGMDESVVEIKKLYKLSPKVLENIKTIGKSASI